eukprot:12419168-Karenia_brevis.AAC.1
MRCDSRVPVSGMITASDASSTGGAVTRSVRLTNKGLSSLAQSSGARSLKAQDSVILLSLFDGISGARRSLDLAGINVGLYVSCETDAQACRVTRYAWPDVLEMGDVLSFGEAEVHNIFSTFAICQVCAHYRWLSMSGSFWAECHATRPVRQSLEALL